MTPQEARFPWAGWLLAVSMVVVTLLAVVPVFYAAPLADDLHRAALVQSQSPLRCVVNEYQHWSGRWSGVGLSYLYSGFLDVFRFYPLALLLAACIFVVGVRALVGVFYCFRPTEGWGVAWLFCLVYWGVMPFPGETTYWMSGGIEYQLSMGLYFLAFALLAEGSRRARPLVWLAPAGVLLFVAEGMHEMYAFLVCVVLLACVLIAYRCCRAALPLWMGAFLIAVAGFLFVYLAPGNADRLAEFERGGQLPLALKITLRDGLSFVSGWLVNGPVLLASLLFLMAPSLRECRPGWLKSPDAFLRVVFLSAFAGVLVLSFFGPAWATGTVMPWRTRNGNFLLFLLGWFIFLRMFAGEWTLRAQWLRDGARVLLALALLSAPNSRVAISDFYNGRFARYQAVMEERCGIAQAQQGQPGVVVVPAMQDRPSLFSNLDIRGSGDFFTNQVWADYFDLSEIRTGTRR